MTIRPYADHLTWVLDLSEDLPDLRLQADEIRRAVDLYLSKTHSPLDLYRMLLPWHIPFSEP